jgi:hypothetical protein
MPLLKNEVILFYSIWCNLVWVINNQHNIIPFFEKPSEENPLEIPLTEFIKVRNGMWDNPHWIDEFLNDKDNGVTNDEERGIIKAWRDLFFRDRFFVVKHLAKYSIFMSDDEERLYAVHGIAGAFSELTPIDPPYIVETVLIPFKGKIIYDSLYKLLNINFGRGAKSHLNSIYNEIKKNEGIITNLSG